MDLILIPIGLGIAANLGLVVTNRLKLYSQRIATKKKSEAHLSHAKAQQALIYSVAHEMFSSKFSLGSSKDQSIIDKISQLSASIIPINEWASTCKKLTELDLKISEKEKTGLPIDLEVEKQVAAFAKEALPRLLTTPLKCFLNLTIDIRNRIVIKKISSEFLTEMLSKTELKDKFESTIAEFHAQLVSKELISKEDKEKLKNELLFKFGRSVVSEFSRYCILNSVKHYYGEEEYEKSCQDPGQSYLMKLGIDLAAKSIELAVINPLESSIRAFREKGNKTAFAQLIKIEYQKSVEELTKRGTSLFSEAVSSSLGSGMKSSGLEAAIGNFNTGILKKSVMVSLDQMFTQVAEKGIVQVISKNAIQYAYLAGVVSVDLLPSLFITEAALVAGQVACQLGKEILTDEDHSREKFKEHMREAFLASHRPSELNDTLRGVAGDEQELAYVVKELLTNKTFREHMGEAFLAAHRPDHIDAVLRGVVTQEEELSYDLRDIAKMFNEVNQSVNEGIDNASEASTKALAFFNKKTESIALSDKFPDLMMSEYTSSFDLADGKNDRISPSGKQNPINIESINTDLSTSSGGAIVLDGENNDKKTFEREDFGNPFK